MTEIVLIVAMISIVAMTGIFIFAVLCLSHNDGTFKHKSEIKSKDVTMQNSTELDIKKHN